VRPLLPRFIFDNSLLLLAGSPAAVVWANVDFPAYDVVADQVFCRRAPGESPLEGVLTTDSHATRGRSEAETLDGLESRVKSRIVVVQPRQ
jgi:hypothetical protein